MTERIVSKITTTLCIIFKNKEEEYGKESTFFQPRSRKKLRICFFFSFNRGRIKTSLKKTKLPEVFSSMLTSETDQHCSVGASDPEPLTLSLALSYLRNLKFQDVPPTGNLFLILNTECFDPRRRCFPLKVRNCYCITEGSPSELSVAMQVINLLYCPLHKCQLMDQQ